MQPRMRSEYGFSTSYHTKHAIVCIVALAGLETNPGHHLMVHLILYTMFMTFDYFNIDINLLYPFTCQIKPKIGISFGRTIEP